MTPLLRREWTVSNKKLLLWHYIKHTHTKALFTPGFKVRFWLIQSQVDNDKYGCEWGVEHFEVDHF